MRPTICLVHCFFIMLQTARWRPKQIKHSHRKKVFHCRCWPRCSSIYEHIVQSWKTM